MNQRTNPIDGNAIHLGLTTLEANFQPQIKLTSGDQLEVQLFGGDAVTDIDRYEYAKWKVTDGKGNEAFGLFTDLTDKITLDISGIVNQSELNVTITLKTNTGIKKEYNAYEVKLNSGIIEMGAYIVLSQYNSLSVPLAGGTATLGVKTNQKLTITSDRDWLTANVKTFEGNTTLKFTATAGSSQIAQVTLTNNSGLTKTIEVQRT